MQCAVRRCNGWLQGRDSEGSPCEGSSGADAADAPAAQTQQTCWGLLAAEAVRQSQTRTAGARTGRQRNARGQRAEGRLSWREYGLGGAGCKLPGGQGALRVSAMGGAMQDVAQMTHHRAEGRHGLRGAEDASAALAELCRAGERGASAKVGATQQYGFTGSRLPRLRGESSSALRLVLVATGL